MDDLQAYYEALAKTQMTLTNDERRVLRTLFRASAIPGSQYGALFSRKRHGALYSLKKMGLVTYEEVPNQSGCLRAWFTDRGLASFRKGSRLGVYNSLTEE